MRAGASYQRSRSTRHPRTGWTGAGRAPQRCEACHGTVARFYDGSHRLRLGEPRRLRFPPVLRSRPARHYRSAPPPPPRLSLALDRWDHHRSGTAHAAAESRLTSGSTWPCKRTLQSRAVKPGVHPRPHSGSRSVRHQPQKAAVSNCPRTPLASTRRKASVRWSSTGRQFHRLQPRPSGSRHETQGHDHPASSGSDRRLPHRTRTDHAWRMIDQTATTSSNLKFNISTKPNRQRAPRSGTYPERSRTSL